MIADSHAHLDMPQFSSDRHEVIRRARDSGVDLIVAIGTGKPQGSSIEDTLQIAGLYDGIWAGIGISPHDERFADEPYWDRLEKWAEHPKVVLWGEIGLDYYHDLSPRVVQREVFRRQLRIARRRNLPVSIHCREAWEDTLTILRQEYAGAAAGGVLHSFTGTRDQALQGTQLGFMISFSGIVTFRNAGPLREAAREVPSGHLLVETDCPYLAPVPHRGRRNEPSYVLDTARALAGLRGVDFQVIARDTSDNLRRMLGFTVCGA